MDEPFRYSSWSVDPQALTRAVFVDSDCLYVGVRHEATDCTRVYARRLRPIVSLWFQSLVGGPGNESPDAVRQALDELHSRFGFVGNHAYEGNAELTLEFFEELHSRVGPELREDEAEHDYSNAKSLEEAVAKIVALQGEKSEESGENSDE